MLSLVDSPLAKRKFQSHTWFQNGFERWPPVKSVIIVRFVLQQLGPALRETLPIPMPELLLFTRGLKENPVDLDLDPLRGNDPSAGSPTETLLRLHLPLNSKV